MRSFEVVLILGLCALGPSSPMQNHGSVGPESSVEGFLGRWEIHMTLGGASKALAILRIDRRGEGLAGEVVLSSVAGSSGTAREIALDGDELVFVLDIGTPVRFRGKRVGDRLEGGAGADGDSFGWFGIPTESDRLTASGEPDLAALNAALRTPSPGERRIALENFLTEFPNSPHVDQASFMLAGTISDAGERLAAREKFVADFPESPMWDLAYGMIFDAYLQLNPLPVEKLLRAIEEYTGSPELRAGTEALGDQRQADRYNAVAERLMSREVLLDKALELIGKAVDRVSGKLPALEAKYLITLGQVRYKRSEYDRAEEILQKAVEIADEETVGEAYLYLGKTREAKNEPVGALEAYLNAAARTYDTQLKTSLERVFLRTQGSLAGLHERVDAILLSKPRLFDPGRYERIPISDSDRVVLAELFTGAECRPCIAADLGLEGVIERFDRETVAVLGYHLHIPGPDPLTNSDSERRAAYYRVGGTPTVIIDGNDRHVGGGSADGAARNFKLYREKIEARLSSAAPVGFSSLALKWEGSTLSVFGELEVPASAVVSVRNARLHLILAEELIHYTGRNGIHFHHYVVRKMLGSPDGLPLPGGAGRIPFSHSLDVKGLERDLKDYLDRYANGRDEFRWMEEPYEVDPGQIVLVAFVQNDETKEVLQSAFAR